MNENTKPKKFLGVSLSSLQTSADDLRQQVRADYAQVARASDAGDCCGVESSCCGVSDEVQINALLSQRLGYSQADLDAVPRTM